MTSILRRFMKASAIFSTLAMLAFAASPAAADTLEKVKKAGVIVIGNGGAFPPFEFVENGKLVGYDIDLGEELGKRMGLKVNWVKIDFRGLIPALTSGRVDMLLTAMAYTKDRADRIAFSDPYFMTGVAAAYLPNLKIEKAEDMIGKRIGVQIGTSGEQFVRTRVGDKVGSLRTYDEFLLAIRDLEAGRIDVVVNTGPTIAYNVSRRGSKVEVSGNFDSRIIGMNTRKDDLNLMKEINKHIADMKSDGFLKKIDLKWFGREMEHGPK